VVLVLNKIKNKSFRFIDFLPLLSILAPYFGNQIGKFGFYLFVIYSSLFTIVILLLNKKYIILKKNIFLLFSIPLIIMILSILHSLSVHCLVGLSDLIELYRPISTIIFLMYGMILYNKYEIIKFKDILFILVCILIIFNFIFTFLPWIRLEPFWSMSDYFGLSSVFHKGYASYRAYGIAGQPGIEAICINILFILLFYFKSLNTHKFITFIIYILFLLNFMALISTVSRIGLVFFVFILIFYSIFSKSVRYIFLAFLAIVFLFILYNYEEILKVIDMYSRGIDFNTGKAGTLEYRLNYKFLIADLLSIRIDTLLFGIGPSKDFLENPLRNPDSSFSVYNIRFGFLGLFLYVLPQLFTLFYAIKSILNKALFNIHERKYIFVIIVLYVYLFLVSNLDPGFDDIKLNILNYTLVGIFFGIITNKRRAHHV